MKTTYFSKFPKSDGSYILEITGNVIKRMIKLMPSEDDNIDRSIIFFLLKLKF
tara:strand:- start:157 stop:315 length:159 start_codon:yes stop_codon:yes gene_type:complete